MIENRLNKMLMLLIIIVTGLILVACSSEDSLVGTWRREGTLDQGHQIIFLENGTGEATNLETGSSNDFTWSSGSLIPFAFSDRFGIEFHEYELDGDTLILRRPGTEVTLTFIRQ